MAGRVIWGCLAEADLAEAYLRIQAESPVAAERFIDAVEDAFRLLVENPSAGREREFRSVRARYVRSWPVTGFPSHLIFYRAYAGDLEVVRLLHGARDIPRLLDDGR